MDFISFAYMLFLAVAAVCYYILPKAARPFWMLACSYTFYWYDSHNPVFVAVLIAMTAVTFGTGLLLSHMPKERIVPRRLVLAAALCLCFGCLILYKYSRLLFGTAFSLAVPLGISYFTFQATGYLIDMYRLKYPAERNFLYYALFVGFFPSLIAGPIERASNMLPQFKKMRAFDYSGVSGGLFRVLWGFFKKLVIANALVGIVRPVYARIENYPGPMLLLVALLFSLELYMDFSALSDIAIGTGAVFGFTMMENFENPLAARSFTDLWRRWHISLSSWFRDYLYFPLGGNRKGRWRTDLNQIIVFTVCGLWHGAAVGYLCWGLLTGLLLCFGKETAAFRTRLQRGNPLYQWKPLAHFWQMCGTYLTFSFTLIFFAAQLYAPADEAWLAGFSLLGGLFSEWGALFDGTMTRLLAVVGFEGTAAWVLVGGIVLIFALEYLRIPVNKLIRRVPIFLRWPLYYALVLAIYFFGDFGVSGFVYQAY